MDSYTNVRTIQRYGPERGQRLRGAWNHRAHDKVQMPDVALSQKMEGLSLWKSGLAAKLQTRRVRTQ